MKILSIDSSGLVATVAVMADDILVGEYTIHNKKTHSQTLLPMIADMLAMAEVAEEELDCIAVSAGPGSFTGLRIGASTAKGLAWTLGIPIVPVSSLMGLAANIRTKGALVCPIMDARRSQVYYGVYRIGGDIPECLVQPDVAPIEDVIRQLSDRGEPVVFLGDGVPVFEQVIEEQIVVPVSYAEPYERYQRAASVARIGQKLYQAGEKMSAAEFAPVYLRKSQAEREREEAEKKG